MAHLTYFDTIEEYNAYINSEDYVSPNISYCADADAVFMKENFVPSMSAVFNITSTGTTQIANTTDGIKAIKVDGQLMGELSKLYKFESTGNHTVEYQFRKQNTIPKEIFYDFTAITSVNLSSISYIGDTNFYGCTNIAFGNLVFNGNIGNNCFAGAYGLTSLTVNGNVGSSCFNSATGLTTVTVNGNVGSSCFNSCNSLTTINVSGNIADGNLNSINTLTTVIVGGNVGNGNLNGCSSIATLKIGGKLGSGNLASGSHQYDLVEIGGDVEYSDGFICNTGLTSVISISGSVLGSGSNFYSGDTLTIKGSCLDSGNPIQYWKNVIIEENFGGSGNVFYGVQNMRIKGNLTGNGCNWVGDTNLPCQSFTIDGSITATYNFTGGTIPMINVGGNIASYCFTGINITGTTSYSTSGNVGDECFVSVSGLTDVTVDGNVGVNSFSKKNGNQCHITALTLSENCTSYGGFYGTTYSTSLTKLTVLATTPPTFSNELPSTVDIYVPADLVDTYKAASGWSTYASQIQAISN
jgi:hypothetical protein